MHSFRYPAVVLSVFAGCVLVLVGCGGGQVGNRLAITGTVSYKGAPLTSGSIQFQPDDPKKTLSGAVITNGRFSIPADKGLEPGDYLVRISSPQGGASDEPGGVAASDPKDLLPDKYNANSTLKREVKKGQTDFEFKLD